MENMDKHAGHPGLEKMPRENAVDGGAPKKAPAEKPMGDQSFDLPGGNPAPSPAQAGKRFKERL